MSGIRFIRPGRRFVFLSIGALSLVLGLCLAAGWYYSSLIHSELLKPDYSPDTLNLQVVSVDGDRIVLMPRQGQVVESLDDDELWGIEGEAGYGQVGPVLSVDETRVTRQFRLLSGTVVPDDYARLDSFAFRGDPLSSRGLAYRSVLVPSPLGDWPAWELDGTSETWVIFVHGWRSDREEALRILPSVSSLGLRSLVITYRNDEQATASADGLIWWGATEWQDLQAAVDYAVAHGAKSVVLYGFSMGGGIAMNFLERSDRSGVVSGVILDAPVLDFSALVDFQADKRHVPGVLAVVGKQFATWRFGVDWASMDYLSNLDRIQVPILLFHGDDDDRAPIKTSRRLASKRSDLVTFVVVNGAGHVRSWNVDPEAYQQEVRHFLAQVAKVPVQ